VVGWAVELDFAVVLDRDDLDWPFAHPYSSNATGAAALSPIISSFT